MTDLVWTPNPAYDADFLFDVRGHRRTGSLFAETTQDKNRHPVFTLRDYDYNGLPSMYQLYMRSTDEYEAAMLTVGSMTHWRKLMSSSWFMTGDSNRNFTGLTAWRKDMQARDASMAKSLLMSKVREGDRQAAQFLMTYATKGDTAGLKESTKAKPKAADRRGVQGNGEIVDLNSRFDNLQDLNINGN